MKKLEDILWNSSLFRKCFFIGFSSFVAYSLHNATPVFAQPNPESMYHFMVGNLHRENDEMGKAFESYREAYKHDPNSPSICNGIGEVLMKEGKFDPAASYFRDAIRLDKDFLPAHNNLSSFYIVQNKFSKAFEEANFVLSRKPEDSDALRHAGESKFGLKNLPEARAYFEKLVHLSDVSDSNSMFAYHRLGFISLKEKKLGDGIDYLQKSNNLVDIHNPADRMVGYDNLFLISLTQYSMGNYAEAKTNLKYLLKALSEEKVDYIKKAILDMIADSNLIEKVIEATQNNSKNKTPNTAIDK